METTKEFVNPPAQKIPAIPAGIITAEAESDEESAIAVYSSADNATLNYTKQIRLLMVDAKLRDGNGIPTKSGDIRVINEVLNSMDDSVHKVAAARLKHGENKSKAQTQELIANILKQVKLNDDEVTVLTVTSKSTDLPDEFVPIETVPGAMDIGPNQLTLADINMDIKEL